MDLLRFLFLLPVRLLRAIGHVLGLLLRPLFGDVRWSAPGWMHVVQRRPLRSAGILFAAARHLADSNPSNRPTNAMAALALID